MSRVPWHVFRKNHPRPHLVVASGRGAQTVGGSELKTAQTVLERLIRTLAPAGDYTTSIVREADLPEVYLAFANELDARTFVDAVSAKVAGSGSDWASRHTFAFDSLALATMTAALPPPKRNRRPTR